MKRRLIAAILFLLTAQLCFGQAARFDNIVSTINSSAPAPGGFYPALYIPGSGIAVCTAPANAVPCTNYATTYSSASAATACPLTPSPLQLTRPGSNTCVAGADATGGWGVWMLSGTYQYTVTTAQGSYGPYDFSVGGTGGGGGGSTPAGPAFAINGANSLVNAFTADSDILFNPTSTFNPGGLIPHSLDLIGPPTTAYANPTVNDAFEKYAGLPIEYNVLTDCPNLTGLQVVGNGTTDDLQAVQQCIWQRKNLCPIGTICTPTNGNYKTPNLGPVKFVFPPRNFTRGIGLGNGCDYYFSTQLDLPYGTEIESTGGGKGDTSVTFCFPSGSNGLIVRGFSTVENIMLYGNSCWVSTNAATYILPSGFGGSATGDGVVGTQESQLDNVSAWCFGRHGFNMSSTNTQFPGSENDAGHVTRSWAAQNGGWGFYYHGNDSQESICSGCESNNNQLGGFWDDSIYGNEFDAPLTQQNHEDKTTPTALPAITDVSCTLGSATVQSVCTLTFASAHGMSAGSVLDMSTVTFAYGPLAMYFSPYCLNASGVQCGVQSAPTTTTVTVNNPTYYPDNESGAFTGAMTYPGTNIWAAAGSLTPGQPAWGGSVYCFSGQWNLAYSEGNEPYGNCKNAGVGGSKSVMISPEGASDYYPLSGFVGTVSNNTGTAGISTGTVTNQAENTSVQMVTGGMPNPSSGLNTVFDIFHVIPQNSNPTNLTAAQLGEIFFARSNNSVNYNSAGNLGNWYCWFLGNNGNSSQYTGNLNKASECYPDQRNSQLVSPLIVTNGGSGYSSTPTLWVTNIGVQPVFQVTVSGGVITSVTCGPCGQGTTGGSVIDVFDPTGTGAVIGYTYPNEPWPSSDSGRSATQNRGLAYAPAYRAIGTIGSTYQPQIVEFTCSTPPTTGNWLLGDMCYNTAFTGSNAWAWEVTTAGTPGTWTPLYAGSGGGGSGTVTAFSAGNLSPLFTTSVANPTTTPALSFTISNAAQNSIFAGPASGGAGNPSFQTAPVFSAANLTGFPTFNQNTTGNAATATNLASYPTLCSGGQFSQGLSSGSNNCATPSGGGGSISVNGSVVSSPNINDTTPSASSGKQNVTWQVSSSNVSGQVPLPTFSAITGSTNTTAAMLVGSGASLAPAGSGVVNANQLGGVAVSGSAVSGYGLVATSPTAATWQNFSALNSTPNQNATYASPNCGTQTNCYPVNDDAKWAVAPSWSNSSSTVTIGASDPPFLSTDCTGGSGCTGSVNKKIFGVGACVTNFQGTKCTLQVPIGTISSFISSTSVTISTTTTAACSTAGTCVLAWGDDDTSNLQTAFAAALATNGQLQLPCGGMFVDGRPFDVTAKHPFYPVGIAGCGSSAATFIIPTPDFSFSGITVGQGAIIYDPFAGGTNVASAAPNVYSNFYVWGLGNQLASGPVSGTSVIYLQQVYAQNLWCTGWGYSNTNLTGMGAAGVVAIYGGGVNGCGNISLYVSSDNFGVGTFLYGDSFFGINGSGGKAVNIAGGDLYSWGNQFQGNIDVTNDSFTSTGDFITGTIINAGILDSTSDSITNNSGTTISNTAGTATFKGLKTPSISSSSMSISGGTLNFYDSVLSSSSGIGASAGTLQLRNTSVAGVSGFPTLNLGTSSKYNDLGGNTITGANAELYGVTGTGGLNGQTMPTGICTGVATSSINSGSYLYLYGMGGGSASTCTVTSPVGGYVVQHPGTIQVMYVTATAAGQSGSGVMSVFLTHNGSTTTESMTCTISTGTSCSDLAQAHNFAVVPGDIIQVGFTTQASETLANVTVKLWNQY